MNNQSSSHLQNPPAVAPALSGETGTAEKTLAVAAPTLTFSRGTRPLIMRRSANDDSAGFRHRSA